MADQRVMNGELSVIEDAEGVMLGILPNDGGLAVIGTHRAGAKDELDLWALTLSIRLGYWVKTSPVY